MSKRNGVKVIALGAILMILWSKAQLAMATDVMTASGSGEASGHLWTNSALKDVLNTPMC